MATHDKDSHPAHFRAHWSIFLPVGVVALLYGGLWLLLTALGRGGTDLARLLAIVAAAGVPLLLAHAVLRYKALALEIGAATLRYRRGWFRPRWHDLPLEQVQSLRPSQTRLGRMLGAGSLMLRLRDGEQVRFDDLSDPNQAARLLRDRLGVLGHNT